MKKLYKIILLLFFSNFSYSQDYLKFSNIEDAISVKEKEISKTVDKNKKYNKILDLVDLYRIRGNIDSCFSKLELINTQYLLPKTKSRYLDLKALLYYYSSDVEQAKKLLDKSYKIKQNYFNNDSSIFAYSYLYFSKYYMQLRDHKKALYFSKKALSVLSKTETRFILIESLREYAYDIKYKDKNRKKNSLECRRLMLQTVEKCKKLNYNFYLAQLYHDIGNTYTDNIGRFSHSADTMQYKETYRKAHYYYNLDLKIRNKYLGKNNEINGITWFTKALLELFSGGDRFKEVKYYNNAIRCYFPKYMQSDNLNLISNKYQVLEMLQYKIQALIKIYEHTKDTNVLLQVKKDVELSINLWKDILLHYKSFEIGKVLGVDNTIPFDNAMKISSIFYEITKDKKYLNDIFQFSEMQKHAVINRDMLSMGGNFIKQNIINLKDAQDKLSNNQAIIEYSEKNIILIKKDTFIYTEQYLEMGTIIDKFLKSIYKSDIDDFTNLSYDLYSKLILPVKDNLHNINDITIIPFYKISLIPFDCLISEKTDKNAGYGSMNYLINDYKISYGYSATLKYNKTNLRLNSAIYGISPKFSKNKALPFSRKLLSYLSENYKSTFYQKEDSSFFKDVNNYSIIHIATHTKLDDEDNFKSKILTGNANNDFVEIGDFYKNKIHSQLAVVLACETAKGNVYKGDQTNSFVRAFKYAGVPSVISTLWQVDDEVSNEIMTNFYNNLLENNQNISTSLHNAKMQYLANAKYDEDYNPYYWAGIIFTGSDVKINIEKKRNFNFVLFSLIIISLALILLIIRYKKRINVN